MTRLLRIVLTVAVAASPACAHFRIAPGDVAPATTMQRHRVHVVGWGAFESHVTPVNCQGVGLASVTMTVTSMDALAALVTAGFWNTATVEWTCAKDRDGWRP
jgi:hypothetical protein